MSLPIIIYPKFDINDKCFTIYKGKIEEARVTKRQIRDFGFDDLEDGKQKSSNSLVSGEDRVLEITYLLYIELEQGFKTVYLKVKEERLFKTKKELIKSL